MSSAVLYLAIVAVWGVVLVPMWLRRDGDGIGRLLLRRADAIEPLDESVPRSHDDAIGAFAEPSGVEESDGPGRLTEHREVVTHAEPPTSARRRRATRAAVIARRRRRTLGLTLLTLTAVAVVSARVAPWWFVLPPVLLLGGHLSLLRVAVRMDAARRQERRRAAALRAARLRHARQAREAAEVTEAARVAEVIELRSQPEEVYDQYSDLRAVGD